MQNKSWFKVLGFIMARGIYILLGAILALTWCQASPQEMYPEFLEPNLKQASDCIEYLADDEETVNGQVCFLQENNYMYMYLPVETYGLYMASICARLCEDMPEKEDKRQGSFIMEGSMDALLDGADVPRSCQDPWSNRKILF